MRGDRGSFTFLAATLVAGTWATVAPAQTINPPVVKPAQTVVSLLSAHEAFSRPTRDSARLVLVRKLRPITEEQTVLPVIGARLNKAGFKWLRVRLPGRPNERTGWIRRSWTSVSTTPWHVVVDLSRQRVIVYRDGRAVRYASAIVGKPSTPTPTGEFFVEESVALRPLEAGAPFALALSARSNVLQEFEGGPGQIALHGIANIGGTLGSAVSHGCVRLDTFTMRWLERRIGPGVPVTIRR